MSHEHKALEIIFPPGTFEWFELTESKSDEQNLYFTLVEKDIPPTDKTVIARKFHDITITDFPIRGKRSLLTFRRRYWKVEGQEEYVKRDIQVTFPGTQLATEFASFLKDDGGRGTILAGYYRKMAAPPSERI